jgi:hypothetical protein
MPIPNSGHQRINRNVALQIAHLFRTGKYSELMQFVNEGRQRNLSGFNDSFIDYVYSQARDRNAPPKPDDFETASPPTEELATGFSSYTLVDSFSEAVGTGMTYKYLSTNDINDDALVKKIANATTVEELEKILPYKGKIYLPTEKYSVAQQVKGIQKTAAYLSISNSQASVARLSLLRRLIGRAAMTECLIVANGPSLKHTNLAVIDQKTFVIGLNSIFLHPYLLPHVVVCEDHLVGEDRAHELNGLKTSLKVIPGYLTYCIDPDDLTIVLNHRPRASFPVDIDFSSDIDRITYTGGTVTYTALQLAVGLGFKKISLVGVDASYKIENVKTDNQYATGILESLGDDPNHFNSGYFGKGYRWHDPNSLRMRQAYSVADRYARANSIEIINRTRGGMLDVFQRSSFTDSIYHRLPRVCILDWIDIHAKAATGEVKKALYKDWPRDKLLNIYSPRPSEVCAYRSAQGDLLTSDYASILPAWKSVIEYQPSVYYWRPTHNRPLLNLFAALLFRLEDKPVALHLMDYWVAKIANEDLKNAYKKAIRASMKHSRHVFAISSRMKTRLCKTYQLHPKDITVAHNYAPSSMGRKKTQPNRDSQKRLVFYSGNLDPDQSVEPLLDICSAIQVLNTKEKFNYSFLIRTSESHLKSNARLFDDYNFVTLEVQSDTHQEYIQQLAIADVSVLCYGFGESSREYLRDSMANKLPDLLTANAKFFAYGDPEIGTINYLKSCLYPFVECARDPQIIAGHIRQLAEISHTDFQSVCAESLAEMSSEFSEMAQCHIFQKQLALCADTAGNRVDNDTSHNSHVSFYEKIFELSDLGFSEDLLSELSLMKYLSVRHRMTEAVYQLVRDHGLSWSVNPVAKTLDQSLDHILDDERLLVQALAWMIVSQRHPRYKDLWSRLFSRIVSERYSNKTVSNKPE